MTLRHASIGIVAALPLSLLTPAGYTPARRRTAGRGVIRPVRRHQAPQPGHPPVEPSSRSRWGRDLPDGARGVRRVHPKDGLERSPHSGALFRASRAALRLGPTGGVLSVPCRTSAAIKTPQSPGPSLGRLCGRVVLHLDRSVAGQFSLCCATGGDPARLRRARTRDGRTPTSARGSLPRTPSHSRGRTSRTSSRRTEGPARR